jgi:hypothetical protein
VSGANHDKMNFPESFSNRMLIFSGCRSLAKDTIAVARTSTLSNVSWLAHGFPESLGKSVVCVRATTISSSFVIFIRWLGWTGISNSAPGKQLRREAVRPFGSPCKNQPSHNRKSRGASYWKFAEKSKQRRGGSKLALCLIPSGHGTRKPTPTLSPRERVFYMGGAVSQGGVL